jgi:L,D-transpeptidase catalytic domain
MTKKLTRRDFLKLSSITLGAAAFTTLSPTDLRLGQRLTTLGRNTLRKGVKVLSRPNGYEGELVTLLEVDEVVEIYRAVVGRSYYGHEYNHVWFEIPQGYVYSSWIQPVKDEIQTPLSVMPADGIFAELSVPYAEPHVEPDPNSALALDNPEYFDTTRVYYSTVYKIDGMAADANNDLWYRVANDQEPYSFWLEAKYLRVITPEEISPLSPDVTDKLIVADVETHWLSAYEGKTEVFRTRFSSGASYFAPDGTEHEGINTHGEYPIYSKRITRHMAGGVFPNGYNLPGIGWVSYWFRGAAIHSTYWHNDFGHPRSHGCLNCTPEAAKWLFRWSTPPVPYIPGKLETGGVWADRGTSVEIAGTQPPLGDESEG